MPKILKNVGSELKNTLWKDTNELEIETVSLMAVDAKDRPIDDTISYGKWINHKIVDWTGGYVEPFIHPIEKEDTDLKFD